jgi:hypothetical protein
LNLHSFLIHIRDGGQLSRCLAVVSGAMVLLAQSSFTEEKEKFQIQLSGLARLNATYDTKDLGGSDLFKPSSIPVPTSSKGNQDFFMGAGHSRVAVDASLLTDAGKVRAFIEGDFHNSSTGSTGPLRIRHAFLQYAHWTLGQTWSTFYDSETNPSQIDFEGPNSSTLNRTPLIRYSDELSDATELNIAVEHPTEEITSTGTVGASDQRLPDFAANIKLFRGGGGHFSVAGVVREIRYSVASGEFRSTPGYGGLITGKVSTSGKDNLKFQLTIGKGIARYIEGVRGLGYDAVADTANGDLDPLAVIGSFLAYQHYWAENVHSSCIVGDLRLEKNGLLRGNDFRSGSYFAVNLFWQPVHPVTFGVEFLYGVRENQNGQNGTAARVQFGGQLVFN